MPDAKKKFWEGLRMSKIQNNKMRIVVNRNGFMEQFALSSLVRQAQLLARRAMEKGLRHLKITPVHAAIFVFIEILGERATPSNLAKHMLMSRPSMCALLNRMERYGYVKKTQNLKRKRSICIKFTPEGLRIFNEIKKHFTHEVYGKLSDKEIERIKHYTLIIRNRAASALGIDPHDIPFPPMSYLY